MTQILSRYPDPTQALFALRHTYARFGENGHMGKLDIRQVFARNLRDAIDKSELIEHQTDLAKKAGMSHSHLSEVTRGLASITIDLVADLAAALGIQPWELLADSETTRQAAMAKMLWRQAPTDEHVGKHLPLPPATPPERPKKKSARRARRKSPPGNNSQA